MEDRYRVREVASVAGKIDGATIWDLDAEADGGGAAIHLDSGSRFDDLFGVRNVIAANLSHDGLYNHPDNHAEDFPASFSAVGDADGDAWTNLHSGDGLIEADPLFEDAAAGDLRLSAGSPCVDAGVGECDAEPLAADCSCARDMGHLGGTAQARFR